MGGHGEKGIAQSHLVICCLGCSSGPERAFVQARMAYCKRDPVRGNLEKPGVILCKTAGAY